MHYEKSCGAVVFRKYHGNVELLLIQHLNGGHWSFPKGHIEEGETESETAIREVKEETGVDVLLDQSFRVNVCYNPQKNIKKDVIYFLAIARSFNIRPHPQEIAKIKWVEISRVHEVLSYENDRQLVAKVKPIIKDHY